MSGSFDSIFKKNDKVDPNLNQIFSKKIENVPIAVPVTDETTVSEEPVVKKFKPTKKQMKMFYIHILSIFSGCDSNLNRESL